MSSGWLASKYWLPGSHIQETLQVSPLPFLTWERHLDYLFQSLHRHAQILPCNSSHRPFGQGNCKSDTSDAPPLILLATILPWPLSWQQATAYPCSPWRGKKGERTCRIAWDPNTWDYFLTLASPWDPNMLLSSWLRYSRIRRKLLSQNWGILGVS